MSASQELRALRVSLWNEDPRCHWCGVVTNIQYENPSAGRLATNDATLDHVHHRNDPRRRASLPKQASDVVLACYHCNNRRACAFQNGVMFDPRYLPGKVDWNRKWEDERESLS